MSDCVEFELDPERNSIRDLAAMLDIIRERTGLFDEQVNWCIRDRTVPRAVVSVWEITDAHAELIRDDIRAREWDGPVPTMDWYFGEEEE